MLTPHRGLGPRDLAAVADLEHEVVAHDGGRLKLDWGTLRDRSGERVEDLLWWDGDRLVGFLGMYAHGGEPVELSGMVAPGHRGRGIGGQLLDAALDLARDRGHDPRLLVLPGSSGAGRHLAQVRGGTLHHSEHALALTGEPDDAPEDARTALRPAVTDDAATVARLLEAGFGVPRTHVEEQLASEREPTLVIERDGVPVGTLRVAREGTGADVYGFVVDPAWQGRGIGREALRRVCRRLRAEGVERIGLEVEVDNERALGLYTSVGFTRVTTEDYYALP